MMKYIYMFFKINIFDNVCESIRCLIFFRNVFVLFS